MTQRSVLKVVAWVLPAIAAAAVGTAALDIVGVGILGRTNQPMNQQDVDRQLGGTTTRSPTSATPPTSTSSQPGAPPGSRWLNTPGGTVLAYCQGDLATLHRWIPASGYRDTEDDVKRGPAPAASIRFLQGKTELDVTVTCHGGEPQAATSTETH